MIGFEFVLLVSYQVVNYFSHELFHVANLSRVVLSPQHRPYLIYGEAPPAYICALYLP
jgi:hypothetical protein